jgi:hypothetical protein
MNKHNMGSYTQIRGGKPVNISGHRRGGNKMGENKPPILLKNIYI